jgi:hypothetical protein
MTASYSRIIIKLADGEWGNDVMRDVAKEYAADNPHVRPLFVDVWEHAGWSLGFLYGVDGIPDGAICGSANDLAVYPRAIERWRDTAGRHGQVTYLPTVDRNHAAEAVM